MAEPSEFLKSILRFLDVSAEDAVIPHDVALPHAHREARSMPLEIRRWLTGLLYPQYEALHQRFDTIYTERWLQRAKTVLQKDESMV